MGTVVLDRWEIEDLARGRRVGMKREVSMLGGGSCWSWLRKHGVAGPDEGVQSRLM